jgi:hypothetical protein
MKKLFWKKFGEKNAKEVKTKIPERGFHGRLTLGLDFIISRCIPAEARSLSE